MSRLFIICFSCIVALTIFFRFFELEQRMQFTWDQIENAWMMKNMIIDGHRPLVGMQAKGTSGFSIGPAYYYLLMPFYVIFDLDPIAGGYFAGFVSIITLFVFVFVLRQTFDNVTALVGGFIYACSWHVIEFDRIPWPVVLLPLIGILFFFFLVKVIEGKSRYLLLLATVCGFAFHVHFTAIFLPVIAVCAIPAMKLSKKFLLHGCISFLLFIVWFIPMLIANSQAQGVYSTNVIQYASTYFHGIHLRRILQLFPEVLLELSSIINYAPVKFLRYLFLPLFALFMLQRNRTHGWKILYVVVLFFAIPLVILSTYRGELTLYYYSIDRLIAVMIISVILARFYRVVGIAVLCVFTIINLQQFFAPKYVTLPKHRINALEAIAMNRRIEFSMGDPVSYLYSYYQYRHSGIWPK